MAQTDKQSHRQLLYPLLTVIQSRFTDLLKRPNERKVSYETIAKVTGVSYTSTQRVLSRQIASPDYVTLTKLIVASGMTPNEAAKLVGLWEEKPLRKQGTQLPSEATANFETFRHLVFSELSDDAAVQVLAHASALAHGVLLREKGISPQARD